MISVSSLTFGYRAEEPVVEQLSWEFAAGTATVISGVSGRGKSTLLYLLGLLVRPWSGSVIFRGEDVTSWPDRRRSDLRAVKFGFVFQDAALDTTRTVLDNIVEGSFYAGMSRWDAAHRAADLMERFGVGLRGDHRPGEISGGQAARVALCRAFMTDPDVILADEPTGNLDEASATVVLTALTDATRGGATTIIASHDPMVMRSVDVRLDLDSM